MPRAKNAVARHKRKKRLFKAVKGYRGGRSKLLRTATESYKRALQFSFNDRRKRPGDFRRLWITRINAACRMRGMSYSRFINGLLKAEVQLNRKQLSEMAIESPTTFDKLVEIAKQAV